MAEYSTSAVQTVAAGSNVLFTARDNGCSCGITHRPGSGLFTLRGSGRYRVQFGANVAVAAGGAVGPVSVALTLDGEPLYASTATVTPAAVGEFNNVTAFAEICVPCNCCLSVAVRNVSTPAVAIDVANANMTVTRVN